MPEITIDANRCIMCLFPSRILMQIILRACYDLTLCDMTEELLKNVTGILIVINSRVGIPAVAVAVSLFSISRKHPLSKIY